jgi:hypothetical protein
MARLKIRVDVKNGKTVSKAAANKVDKIVFQNDADNPLAVTITNATDSNSPICDSDGPVPNFEVDPNDRETFVVCGDWPEFKYTATVTGAAAEDPIVIIEKKKKPIVIIEKKPIVIIEKDISGSEALWALTGIVIGLLVGVVLARTLGPRPARD